MNTQFKAKTFYPILFGFFVMGFVDIVGIATNYVKKDFELSDTYANLLPMMVFAWFAIFSIPTGILMGKIGKKLTVIMALATTTVAMIVPFISYTFASMLLAFTILGISNTILQVSLNPMIANVVSANKIASTLTLGQFVKAISSFLGPIVAGGTAILWGDWKITFGLYAVISLFSTIWMYRSIPDNQQEEDTHSNLLSTLSLLKDRKIFLIFLGILFIVGVDVGLNTTIPNFLTAQANMPLSVSGLGNSLYFISRMAGTFLGTLLLARIKPHIYLQSCILIAIIAFISLLLVRVPWEMFALICIGGLGCSCIFSILFSYALQHKPDQSNEVSALMIIGVSGGALITPLIGITSDYWGVTAGLALLCPCLLYLGILSIIINKPSR